MARLIVKQSNGKYGMWSTIIDDFLYKNLTKEEYIELFARIIYEEKIEKMKRVFEKVENGDKNFNLYLKSYEECLEILRDKEH